MRRIERRKGSVIAEIARDGMILLPEGVDCAAHKAAGSPFIWCHDQSAPDNAIGRVVEYQQSPAALDIVVEFADDGPDGLASKCWAKVQAGLIRSVSIGAAPLATETRQVGGRPVLVVTRSELLEASLVIIGSDRGAVRLDRAAVLRALDTLTKETPRMDKAELAKTLNIGEDADREAAEAACMKYLAGDDEAKMAVVKALDEFYPESPAAGEPAERGHLGRLGGDHAVDEPAGEEVALGGEHGLLAVDEEVAGLARVGGVGQAVHIELHAVGPQPQHRSQPGLQRHKIGRAHV